MGRRQHPQRFPCIHPGCGEAATFTSYTAKEAEDTSRTYNGKWKCVRHYNADALLSPTNRKRAFEMTSVEMSHGRYWGQSGFVSGPGFKAFCNDFPEGTVLRVTAEVILPDSAAPKGEG